MFVAARFSRNFWGKSLKEQSRFRSLGPILFALSTGESLFAHAREHMRAHNTEVFVDGLFSQSRPRRLLNVNNTHAQKFWLSKLQTRIQGVLQYRVFFFVDCDVATPIPPSVSHFIAAIKWTYSYFLVSSINFNRGRNSFVQFPSISMYNRVLHIRNTTGWQDKFWSENFKFRFKNEIYFTIFTIILQAESSMNLSLYFWRLFE